MKRDNKITDEWLDKNVPKSVAFNERLKQFIKPYVISYKNDQTNNSSRPQKKS